MTRIRQWIEAAAAATAIGCARVVPRRGLLSLGAGVGAVVGRLDRRHAAIARENLLEAYGASLAPEERERILSDCWRHFGRITFDALAFRSLRPEEIGREFVLEGEEHVRKAFSAGKGVLVFSAHFGAWEAGALYFGRLGFPLTVIARPLDNPILDRLLVRLRQRTGNSVVPKRTAVRALLKALSGGAGVALLIDQDARQDGVFVPFFGRLVSTTPTPALLALRTGAALLPMYARTEPDGRITVCAEPPVPVLPSEDRDADVVRLTAACTAIVERWVRRDPAQWLWMHRRWKTRPPGESAGPRS